MLTFELPQYHKRFSGYAGCAGTKQNDELAIAHRGVAIEEDKPSDMDDAIVEESDHDDGLANFRL